MKVILLEDVKALGKKGQVVNVSDGYARNLLLPKKLGVEATGKNMNDLKLQKAHEDKVAQENLDAAKAFAEELKDKELTEADVIIAAGLPLTWTSGQKAEFAAYLSKNEEVSYTYQHTDYHVRISGVKIYPQGYAAVAEFVSTMKGLSVVADIGNGTMNTLFLTNGRPMSSKMYTEKFGTYQCTLAIREEFMQKTRREINDVIIDEVLQNGTADIPASDLKIIKTTAAEYVKDIFRRLREHGYDEGTMTLYITGGGGCLVKNFYKCNPDRVKFVDDICAAAKGYEYMAELQLKADERQ